MSIWLDLLLNDLLASVRTILRTLRDHHEVFGILMARIADKDQEIDDLSKELRDLRIRVSELEHLRRGQA